MTDSCARFRPSENYENLLTVSTIDFPSARLDVMLPQKHIHHHILKLTKHPLRRAYWHKVATTRGALFGTRTYVLKAIHAEANGDTIDVAVPLPAGTLCKFYMRGKLVCGMSLCLLCARTRRLCEFTEPEIKWHVRFLTIHFLCIFHSTRMSHSYHINQSELCSNNLRKKGSGFTQR